MNNGLQKKRIKEIANFIVNNITLAEVSTIIIDRSMEVAEYIVKNNLESLLIFSFGEENRL